MILASQASVNTSYLVMRARNGLKLFCESINVTVSQLTTSFSFYVSGSAHHKRSARAGAIQLGGVADL